MSISIPGVKWHVSNMLGKLGLADRHELAAWDGRMTGAAAGHSSGKRAGTAGVAGWLGWKAAVGAGAGLAVAGIVVAAALSHSSAESPAAVIATPAPPQPPALFTASVDFADALSTKVRLELQLASPPTTEYMLSIENGFAIYADGDRSRDYAQTMRLLEGGPNTGNSGIFAIEFDPVPADTQFLEVVLNGTLRKVAMSQAESDRQKTPGAELFQAVPPGTTARAAVMRDPVEVDLTDRAPKEFDSGLGWNTCSSGWLRLRRGSRWISMSKAMSWSGADLLNTGADVSTGDCRSARAPRVWFWSSRSEGTTPTRC